MGVGLNDYSEDTRELSNNESANTRVDDLVSQLLDMFNSKDKQLYEQLIPLLDELSNSKSYTPAE